MTSKAILGNGKRSRRNLAETHKGGIVKQFIDWLLGHPYLAGIAAIATIVGLIIQLSPLPPLQFPPKDCDFFQTDFSVSSPENDDFNKVVSKFAVEKAHIISVCGTKDPDDSIRKLADHYGEQRTLHYSSHRETISDTGSATKGSSGPPPKRASMRAECRSPLIIEKTTFSNTGHGGCYSDEPQRTVISGTVSQSSKGRSECTISAECIYDPALITGYVSSELGAFN